MTQLEIAIEALEKITKDEWDVVSQSTGVRYSGSSWAAGVASEALAKIQRVPEESTPSYGPLECQNCGGDLSATPEAVIHCSKCQVVKGISDAHDRARRGPAETVRECDACGVPFAEGDLTFSNHLEGKPTETHRRCPVKTTSQSSKTVNKGD